MKKKIVMILFFSVLLFSFKVNAEDNLESRYYNYMYDFVLKRNHNAEISDYIVRAMLYASVKYQVPPLLVMSVFAQESNFNINAISTKGAIGIAQIMPTTAKELGIDAYDVGENIEGGVYYLAKQISAFSWAGDWSLTYAVAAYNAGAGAVDYYQGVPPFDETISYVRNISRMYNELMADFS